MQFQRPLENLGRHLAVLLLAAEFGFFLKVIIPATAAAKAPYVVHWLVAVPATAFGLQGKQQVRITRPPLPWGWVVRLLVGTTFDHDVLLNFAVRPDGNNSLKG
jgi:hypothetical protein